MTYARAMFDALVAILRCPVCGQQASFTRTPGVYRCVPCAKDWTIESHRRQE